MTRGEVAKKLGRSIATVRRMEGRELHPGIDERGYHQFDEAEVEEVAEQLKANGRRDDEHAETLPAFVLEQQLRSVRRQNMQLQTELTKSRTENMRLESEERRGKKRSSALDEALVDIAADAIELALENRCEGATRLQFRFVALKMRLSSGKMAAP